jgi:hypothetical protein
MTSMGQMMPKQPLIITIWTHQEMIAWMSSKSIGILDVLMQDFGSDVSKTGHILRHCQSQIQHSMTFMDQMMPKQPLIIIIWTHQETMAWISRKSIGILDDLMKDFGSKLGKLQADFASLPIANPTQHDLHGPDDAQTIIDYDYLDSSRDDGMDEQ